MDIYSVCATVRVFLMAVVKNRNIVISKPISWKHVFLIIEMWLLFIIFVKLCYFFHGYFIFLLRHSFNAYDCNYIRSVSELYGLLQGRPVGPCCVQESYHFIIDVCTFDSFICSNFLSELNLQPP